MRLAMNLWLKLSDKYVGFIKPLYVFEIFHRKKMSAKNATLKRTLRSTAPYAHMGVSLGYKLRSAGSALLASAELLPRVASSV